MVKKTSRRQAVDSVALFKLLADRNRYSAITLLSETRKGLLVGDIARSLGMGHSAMSHLLGLLHEHDIVSCKKEGRTVRYAISGTPLARALIRIIRAA